MKHNSSIIFFLAGFVSTQLFAQANTATVSPPPPGATIQQSGAATVQVPATTTTVVSPAPVQRRGAVTSSGARVVDEGGNLKIIQRSTPQEVPVATPSVPRVPSSGPAATSTNLGPNANPLPPPSSEQPSASMPPANALSGDDQVRVPGNTIPPSMGSQFPDEPTNQLPAQAQPQVQQTIITPDQAQPEIQQNIITPDQGQMQPPVQTITLPDQEQAQSQPTGVPDQGPISPSTMPTQPPMPGQDANGSQGQPQLVAPPSVENQSQSQPVQNGQIPHQQMQMQMPPQPPSVQLPQPNQMPPQPPSAQSPQPNQVPPPPPQQQYPNQMQGVPNQQTMPLQLPQQPIMNQPLPPPQTSTVINQPQPLPSSPSS